MSPRAAKKSDKVTEETAVKSAVVLIPQPHGGALLSGGVPGNAGGGRPQDALIAQLRELGLKESAKLLRDIITGVLRLPFIGVCEACEHEQPFSEEWVDVITNRIRTTITERLKANEQVLKYSQAKELVIANMADAERFFNCVSSAASELFGETGADTLKARAVALMDGKA